MMKHKLYILWGLLLPLGWIACSHELEDVLSVETESLTYRMKFNVSYNDYDGQSATTRVQNGVWEDGEQVYFRFHEVGGDVTGIATYEAATDTWNVKPDKPLVATDIAECEALHFVNPSNSNSSRVVLTTESVIYVDKTATYLVYDDLLIVTAVLSPKTGRIRFKGIEGQTFSVAGLSYYTEYSYTENKYSSKNVQLASGVAADGYSAFAYAYFTDEDNKTLLFDYTDKAGFLRAFPESTLKPGESGYITIPTMAQHDGWTLVNKANKEEITLPEVQTPKSASVRSASAILRTIISSAGNGVISDAGFIYSTQANPTAENGTKISCGTAVNMELRLKELTPETTYYACAYVTNEKGTALSDVVQFTTISKEEDTSSIVKDGFGDDDDLNDVIDSDGSIGKNGYGEDDDLNDKTTSSGSVGRTEYDADDDLNDKITSSGTMGRGEYGDDDSLNESTVGGGNISKGEFSEDDNLN
ncbi:MAG: hypothetical protein IJ013_02040 [Bacteroidaceae bacterium]|nr:hypothetical protein [Bacteroidaceae bacterium]